MLTAEWQKASRGFSKHSRSQGTQSHTAQRRAKTRTNSRHHAHAASGPCPRFQCELYDYCHITGVTEQLQGLVDDLTTGCRRRGGGQYLLYHLHCERHYDRQITKYNDFVKMSPISKFTKPLQYGHCPSQCLSSHRSKAFILDKAVYICEPNAPANTNSTHQQHSVLCVSFGSHIDSTCIHNELIDHNK